MQWSIHYRTVGTSVKLTARVGAEDTVALSLKVQETAGGEDGLLGRGHSRRLARDEFDPTGSVPGVSPQGSGRFDQCND
jgi:hypothetical protein